MSPRPTGRRTSWCPNRLARPSGHCGRAGDIAWAFPQFAQREDSGLRSTWRALEKQGRHSGAARSTEPGISRFRVRTIARPGTTSATSLALQNLEHAIGRGDAALAGGDFGGDEHEASCGTHHAGARDQDIADLAGLDEMHVELDGRHGLLAGDI